MSADEGEILRPRQDCVHCKKSCVELYRIQLSARQHEDKLGWCSKECVEKYLEKEAALKKARLREQDRSVSDFSTGHSYTPNR